MTRYNVKRIDFMELDCRDTDMTAQGLHSTIYIIRISDSPERRATFKTKTMSITQEIFSQSELLVDIRFTLCKSDSIIARSVVNAIDENESYDNVITMLQDCIKDNHNVMCNMLGDELLTRVENA